MMRKVLLLLSFMMSVNVFAQTGLVQLNAAKKLVLHDAKNKNERPLIVVNGAEYEDKLSTIKADDICEVMVIKAADAVRLYGKKAANGAILIMAREPGPDSAGVVPLTPVLKDKGLLILDGEISDRKLADIDPGQIFKLEFLVSPQEINSSIKDTTTHITTRAFAIKQYQQKLSALSSDYRSYLKKKEGDDRELLYVLNGEMMEKKDRIAFIKQLYELSAKDINAVVFVDKYWKGQISNKNPVVLITTKKL